MKTMIVKVLLWVNARILAVVDRMMVAADLAMNPEASCLPPQKRGLMTLPDLEGQPGVEWDHFVKETLEQEKKRLGIPIADAQWKGIVLFGGPYDGHAMDEAPDAEVLLMRHQETREVWAYARSKDVVGGRRVYRVQLRVAQKV